MNPLSEPLPDPDPAGAFSRRRPPPATQSRSKILTAIVAAASDLKRIQWSLAYAAFILYIFIIVTYKLRIANVAIVVAAFGLLLRGRKIRFPPVVVLFGAFVLWAALGAFLSPYPDIVWQTVWDRAKIWIIALVAVNVIISRAQLRFLLLFFVACFILVPARAAVVNYLVGYRLFGRAIGPFIYANPNDLATLTILAIGVACALIVSERKRSWTWLASLASLGALLILVLMTQSRGAFLGLVVMFGPFVALRATRQPKLLIGVGVLAILVIAIAPSGVWKRVAGLSNIGAENLREVDAEGSAEQRFEILMTAKRIVSDHPLLGVGLGAYADANAQYSPTIGRRDTHNTYANLAAETGMPGLVIMLSLLAKVLLDARKARRLARAATSPVTQQLRWLELGLIGFLVTCIFGSYTRLALPYVYLAIVSCMTDMLRREVRAASLVGVAPAPSGPRGRVRARRG